MFTERDFETLEQAARLILDVIERHRIHEENAVDRRNAFEIVENTDTGKVIPFPVKKEKRNTKESILHFTEQEIKKMPKKFQKLFKTQKAVAHIRLKNGKYYEIRVTINGEAIAASSKDLEKAKEKFMEKLYMPAAIRNRKAPKTPTFQNFANEWLENVSKPYVKQITYEDYARLLKNHIYPAFGDKEIDKIDSMDIQKFLNDKGANRTTGKLFTLLGTIFTYATPKWLPYSPMQHVKKPFFLSKEKQPLTKEEEIAFINRLFETDSPYKYTFIVILYTGLRRSELKSVSIDENFVTVQSAKQRMGHPDKFRKIPISPMLRLYMPIGDIPQVRDDTLSAVFKELCPGHTLHELRHTFNVRARTAGIPKPLVEFWLGHKPSRDDVNELHYMHYDEEYQLEEIKKFEYKYPVENAESLIKPTL